MQNDLTKRMLWYFGVLMVVFILSLGITLLATDALYDVISGPRRAWMGWIFIVYASFRSIRVYSQYKQFKSRDHE